MGIAMPAKYYPTGQVFSIALTMPGDKSSMATAGNRVCIAGGRKMLGAEKKIIQTDMVEVLELKP